jgi:uncharacterized protein (UPF0332 family)
MTADTEAEYRVFLEKAMESLASAGSALESGRYNACANRCYYACFQAAVAALGQLGVIRASLDVRLSHGFVQAQFAEQLIGRGKLFPSSARSVLHRLSELRQRADYEPIHVSRTQAERALRRATEFVDAVKIEAAMKRVIHLDLDDRRIQGAFARLKANIRDRFPGVQFYECLGEDPLGAYLRVVLDIDDLDDIYTDDFLDLLGDIQRGQDLPVYVTPVWPRHRVAAQVPEPNRANAGP